MFSKIVLRSRRACNRFVSLMLRDVSQHRASTRWRRRS